MEVLDSERCAKGRRAMDEQHWVSMSANARVWLACRSLKCVSQLNRAGASISSSTKDAVEPFFDFL